MNRYDFAVKDKRWDGKRVYKTLTYPNIPVTVNDIYIITTENIRMDTLAFKYYNDPALWWVIAHANTIFTGRLSLEAGKQIRIPNNINLILSDFDKLNN